MLIDHYPQIRGLILDMDGVLWHDIQPVENLAETFRSLEDMGLKVTFATNNATKSASEFHQKLLGFGVAVDSQKIVTSADAALDYIEAHYAQGAHIFIVGSDSLQKQAKDRHLIANSESDALMADVVLVALDTKVTYQKIALAAALIRSGAQFIATNSDKTYPTPQGLMPGAGTIVAAVEAASGKDALVIGKPQPTLFEMAMRRMGTQPEETLCVGDRLETDILGGQNAGCLTALVLGGVSTLEQAQLWQPQPIIIANNLFDLIHD